MENLNARVETEKRFPLKVAIIGYRGIAQEQHLPANRKISQGRRLANIVALSGRNTEAASQVAREFGISKVYADYQEMLEVEKPDAVIVTSPNKEHAPMTIAALKSGADVLVEKPIATSEKEVEEMIKAAQESGHNFMAALSSRYFGEFTHLLDLIHRDELGEIHHVEAVYSRRHHVPPKETFTSKELSGGGALFDVGIHPLDMGLLSLGYPKEREVIAKTHQHMKGGTTINAWGDIPEKFDVEDQAYMFVSFEGGKSLYLRAAWAIPTEDAPQGEKPDEEAPYLRLVGTKGGAVWYPGKVEIYTQDDMGNPIINRPTIPFEKSRYETQLEKFFEAVHKGEVEKVVPYEQMLTLHRIIDKAYAAAKK